MTDAYYDHSGDKIILHRDGVAITYVKQRVVLPLLTRLANAIDAGEFTLPDVEPTTESQTHSDIELARRLQTRREP